jgi:hypothetical protein
MPESDGFLFELVEDLCEGSLVAVDVTTPSRQRVQIWTDVELIGRTAVLRQFSIYGVTVGSRELGPAMLRRMVRAAMEIYDVDCIRIEEALRVSGASRRRIRPIVFRR